MGVRNHYQNKLDNINQAVVKMGIKVGEMFQEALLCLEDHEISKTAEIIKADIRINQLEVEIEDWCIMLIAKEQPVASDLRKIISALKTVTQLERMGDHAAHIAKSVSRLQPVDFQHNAVTQLLEMGKIASNNFQKTIKAYSREDAELAKLVARKDEKIDIIHKGLMKSLADDISNHENEVEWGLTFIFISRFIERFGDHQLNILEWIIYNKEGRHVEF